MKKTFDRCDAEPRTLSNISGSIVCRQRKRWLVLTAALLFGLAAAVGARAGQPDFTMTLQPDTVTLIPGKGAGLLVSLSPLNGFSNAVTLTTGALPSGITMDYSANPVTPPATSVLTLHATADAALGPFRLDLTGTSTTVTNSTSSSVTVNFGLLPVCAGAVKGLVTDAETGLPLAKAQVALYGNSFYADAYAQTDAQGAYVAANLPLSGDNLPRFYSAAGSLNGYYSSDDAGERVHFTAVCGAVAQANLHLLRKQFGTASGTVTDPDKKPIPGATVTFSGFTNFGVLTDGNGNFQTRPMALDMRNQPARYAVQAYTAGSWDNQTQAIISANSNTVVQLVLVAKCDHITVTGQVVYADSGLPAKGASVSLAGSYQGGSATADTNGNYQITNQTLNRNNDPADCTIRAQASGYYLTNAALTLTSCDTTFAAPLLSLPPVPPPPKEHTGGVIGHVYDLESGIALTNVPIQLEQMGWTVPTDSQGTFLITNIPLGTASSNIFTLRNLNDAYITAFSNVWIVADQTVTEDMRLLRQHYGAVTGTVRDSSSHSPIQDAALQLPDIPHTDQNGRYLLTDLPLDGANEPTSFAFRVIHDGYWQGTISTTLTAGQTNVVDLEMIRICTAANVLGTVVNAVTQDPIAGATVQGAYHSSLTDSKGHFALTNLTVGNDNSPLEITVTATATGFNPQSKTVTIVCGANILTEFGQPQTVFGAIEGYVTNVVTGLPLTNVFMGSQFGAATSTDTNGYYKFTEVPLGANGADTTWQITAMPGNMPQQSKPVLVSSNLTSLLDFGFGMPNTDLAVSVDVSPNPATVGQEVTYQVTLTNQGGDAQNVGLTDPLNSPLTFVRASVSDTSLSTPVFTNGVVSTSISNFLANASVTLTIVSQPGSAGAFTNRVNVTTETEDTNPDNNSASVTLNVTAVGPAQSLQAGPLLFNPQTGLFEQALTVTPGGTDTLPGLQISIAGVSARQVHNASGASTGIAFVQCAQPVSPGSSVSFLIEYYLPDRQTNGFNPQFTLSPLTPLPAQPSTGQVLSLDRDAQLVGSRLLIEFAATPGRTYVVQYSADLQTWENAVPPITAAGNRVQWYDDGPPKTLSKVTQSSNRFYRVLLLP